MLIRRKTGKALMQRKVPMDELSNVRLVVEEMASLWKDATPPSARLAGHAIEEISFFTLRRESTALRSLLSGKRLTDLGAGDPGPAAFFATHYGASEYVAVDGYHDYQGNGLAQIKGVSLVNQDMLEYACGQPDGSTNIMMNAIDGAVLRGPSRLIESAYESLLIRNIARVIPPGGIAFGIMSPILDGLWDFGFERVTRIDVAPVSGVEALYRKPIISDI